MFTKDLRIEFRRLDGIASMVFLAAVVAFILAMAIGPHRETGHAVGPGVLWVTNFLAGSLGLGRLLERERVLAGFSGLLLAPLHRTAIFLGKAAALLLLLIITNVVLVPLVALLFDLPLLDCLLELSILLILGALGYALVSTLLGAVALRTRTGDLLLGAVVYPLVVPLLVGGVKGTAVLLAGGGYAELQPWIGLLLLSDTLFLVTGLWLFDSLTAE